MAGYDNKLPGAAIVIHEVNTTHEIPAIVIDDDGNGITSDNGAMWIVGETFADPTNEVSAHVDSATTSGFRVTISDGNIEDIHWTKSGIGKRRNRRRSCPGSGGWRIQG